MPFGGRQSRQDPPDEHPERRYAANGAISSRASGSASNRSIVPSAASTLASDNGRLALCAQSRNFALNWASLSGFSGDPIGSVASTVTERPSVLCTVIASDPFG